MWVDMHIADGMPACGKKALYACCMLAFVAGPVAAQRQLLPYRGDDPYAMPAILAPATKQAIVKNMLDYCSRVSAVSMENADKAIEAWQLRNQTFVDAAERLKVQMESKFVGSGQVSRKDWDQSFEMLEAMARVAADGPVRQFEAMTIREYRDDMCAETLKSVDNGRFDMISADPGIVERLRAVEP